MKKAFVLLLALLLVAMPVLYACSDKEEEESKDASGEVSGEVSGESGEPFPLEAQNFGGITLTVLARSGRSSQQFCPNEEYQNSVINEAVQTRNDYIEEKYGIVLEVEESGTPATDIRDIIETGLDTYDLVCDAVCRMLPAVTENIFYSLNDVLNLTKPWWDQNANEYLTLSDKIFFVTGDALFMDDLNTAAVLFNKDKYDEYYKEQYGSLYDIVREKRWTIDLMEEMAKSFSQPDENGSWTTTDCTYGILTDGYTGATFLTEGSNIMTAYKDENGSITLHVTDERSVKAFDKVFTMMTDPTLTMFVEQLTTESKWGDIDNMFIENRGLFYVKYINSLIGIMENTNPDKVTPGIVPIPMFNESQADEGYFCGINAYQCEVLGIPTCNQDHFDATCYLLECLGYYSSAYSHFGKECVNYACFETTMKLQSVTNDDDAEMMDYVLTHRLYDLGGIFNWGGKLIGVYSYCVYEGQNNLVSKWDSMKTMVQADMDATIEAYNKSIA